MSEQTKILVVDDEPDVLAYLAAIFEDDDYEVISATGGNEAFELARRYKPALITLDITMPDQTGVRTFMDLKNDPELKDIPVIVVTATVNSEQGFQDLLDGFPGPEGFISKPINPEALLETVRKAIAG